VRHTSLLTAVLVLCFGSPAIAQTRPARVLEAPEARLPESARRARSAARLALPSRSNPDIRPGDVPRLTLPPLDLVRVRRERDQRQNRLPDSGSTLNDPTRTPRTPRAQEIGINRDAQVTERDGRWFTVNAERSWILEVTSPAALETRLHFTDFQLPPGAKLFVASPTGDGEPTYFQDKGPFGTGEFWSPIVNGDTVRMELVDAGNGAIEQFGTLPFHVTSVGHVYEAEAGGFGISAPCELDFSCYPDYATTGQSVAKILFSDTQYLYACSAVLINNLSGDFSPLLLTAHHCISSDSLAKTLSVWWRYQSPSCDSTLGVNITTSSYATLLATTLDTTDASLLQIVGLVPNTSTWAAWTTEDPDVGSNVTGIHHPHADEKKISFGKHVTDQETNRHSVMWDSGIMEPGSSGSPLFNANHQVVGQLWGGESTCSVAGPDVFGKLRLSEPQLTGPNGWNYLEKGISDDQYYPNQTRSSAASLSLPSTQNLVLKWAADDWFHVSLAAGQSVIAGITYNSPNAYISAELYRGSEPNPVATTTGPINIPFDFTNTDPAPVDVYLHFFIPPGNGVRVDYKLSLTEPVAPSVESNSTSPRSFGLITMSGTAGGNGWPVTAWFEVSTDAEITIPIQTTPKVLANSITGVSHFDDYVTGLDPNTTYYFRAVASTPGGTSRSPVYTASTSPLPVPTSPTPGGGQHMPRFPEYFYFYGGGSTFDFYVGTNPNPPLVKSGLTTLLGGAYSQEAVELYLGYLMLYPATHYYWEVTEHYKSSTASGPIYDFYTPQLVSLLPSTITLPPVLVGTTGRMSVHVDALVSNVYPIDFSTSGTGFSAYVDAYNNHSITECYSYCFIWVELSPTVSGPMAGTLQFTSPGASGSTIIPITASGFDMSLTRPSRPQRPGVVSAGQSQQLAFRLDTSNVPGEVGLSCQVIPALANCEVSSGSVSGSGTHELSVTLHTVRRAPRKLRKLDEGVDDVELGTPPGAYTVRVTAAFAGVTRTIDFPLQVR
jgi:Trypsin-like peptidase domain